MSPLKEYQGPTLPTQTPDGAAFATCPVCGNIVFGAEGCKVCAAEAKVTPRLPPGVTEVHAVPEEPADLLVLRLEITDRGTLGFEIGLVDGDEHQVVGRGETVPQAFLAAWDQWERPPLDPTDLERWAEELVLGAAMTGDERRAWVEQIARAAVARAEVQR